MSQCQFQSCNRPSETNGKCILHCKKGSYSEDFRKANFLRAFYHALADEITNLLFETYGSIGNIPKPMLKRYLDGQTENEGVIENIISHLESKIVTLREIWFPDRKDRDNFDFLEILKKVHSIHFINCKFQAWNLNLNKTKVFFDECTFKNSWNIYDFELLGNDRNVIHQNCTFNKDVNLHSEKDESYHITSTLFSDCQFLEKLSIHGVIVDSSIFNNTENTTLNINEVNIWDSEFNGRFILNSYEIETWHCESSIFEDKLELKDCRIKNFLINDSNYTSLVDFFDTNFEKFTINKSIFENFVGFEDCNFGNDNHTSDSEFISTFKYVTFLDFVNFRNSNFMSGLDLGHVNLNEPPNFLNVNVAPNNTTRETFRIIKHSFDRIGNFIEGNNFYKFEMLKLKEETKPNKSRSKYWLLKIYELTSSYGQSYLKPLFLIIVSSIIYWLLNIGYENNWLYKIYPDINNEINWVAEIINGISSNIIPFKRILKVGMESISLIFYIIFSALIWLVILAIKRNTKR